MPLLKRLPFIKAKPPPNLKPDDQVFHCKLTNEIFADYEKFFERIILCNSLVWSCSITGKSSLTYQEALESESKARKQLAGFPEYFEKPLLYLASLTHRSRLNELNDDVFLFCKDRYFASEVVDVIYDDEKKVCKVVQVLPPEGREEPVNGKEPDADSDVICLDSDTDEEDKPLSKMKSEAQSKDERFGTDPTVYQYVVQEFSEPNIYIVSAQQVSRKKGVFTREKCKLYLKLHCSSEDGGVWKVKERYLKKFKLRELSFEDFFEGPKPSFVVSKVKSRKKHSSKGSSSGVIDLTEDDHIAQAKNERKERKKWEREEKKRMKKEEKKAKKQKAKAPPVEKPKMTEADFAALREKLKQEKLAERIAKKAELKKKWEEEKMRRKETRDQEREKKKEEKRQKEEYLREWNRPRDDMECDDLQSLPVPTPIQSHLPNELFGDAVMLMEYLHCFKSLYELKDFFPYGIHFNDLARSLMEPDIQGMYLDLLKFLLTALFNLQDEEDDEPEEDEDEANMKMPEGFGEKKGLSYKQLIKESTIAAQWPQLNYSTPLGKMQLDAFTVTEVLRLHFLSSGGRQSETNNKFRYQQRGGYTSFDDAGLEFRRQEVDIIKALSRDSAFDLSAEDKLKILTALVNQLLSYAACRDFVEETADKCRQIKQDLKQLQSAEQKRDRDETTFWYRKRLEEKAKEKEVEAQRKEQKKREKEEKLKAEESGEKVEENKPATEKMEVDVPEAKVEKKSPPSKPKESKIILEAVPERKSSRQRAKDERDDDLKDLPVENIDWDKVSPHERVKMKDRFMRKEKELLDLIDQLQHGHAVSALGKDRSFRRYWMFRCIPGLFVEDNEQDIPEDFLIPIEQKAPEPFHSDSLPLEASKEKPSGEEKSTSSDKENDSFDHGKSENIVVSSEIPLGANAVNRTRSQLVPNEPEKEEDATVNEKKEPIVCQSVDEQIAARNSVRWAYFDNPQQIDKLIESLNTRGLREGHLKQTLLEQKPLLDDAIKKCPVPELNLARDETEASNSKSVKQQSLKSRHRITHGAVNNSSASELLELNLRETLLDLEERIFIGTLGAIKVPNRAAWRDAIEDGGYYQQCEEVTWTLKTEEQKVMEREREAALARKALSTENSDKMEVGESKADDNPAVYDLARALMQIYQGVEAKYLNPPLGEDEQTKKTKQKAAVEAAFRGLQKDGKLKNKQKKDQDSSESDSDEDDDEEGSDKKATPVERWEGSLMASSSLSQVFLHLSVLENSITWDKSALHARCRICRRKGDAEHMLLCDGCDKGHHMYCLKPAVKSIPRGDWYCPDCKPKDLVRTPLKRRKSSVFDEEPEAEEEDSDSSEAEEISDDDSDDGESTAEDSDSDEDSDEEESDDSDEDSDEDTETEAEPPKIKFLRGMKRKPDSGRSTPTSVASGRSGRLSREPKQETRPTRSRHSVETSQPAKGRNRASLEKPAAKKSRHSLETTKPKQQKGKASAETSRRSGPTGARRNLELEKTSRTEQGGKRGRGSDDTETTPPSKKPALTKSRSSSRVSVMNQVEQLVTELSEKEEAWPFLMPVTKRDAPDYFDFVKSPMDFSTIKNKINKFAYQKPGQILADMRLIFKNCHDYNIDSSAEYQAGQKMSRLLNKRCKDLHLDALCSEVETSPKKSPVKAKANTSKPSRPSPGTSRRSTRSNRS